MIGLFTADYLQIENKLLFFSLLIILSLLPDIDKSDSKIGRKLWPFSKIINFLFGHRNFFHSFLFIIPAYIIFSLFSGIIAISFLIAASSHLVLDAFTIEGISPFYPLKYRIKGMIKTGKITEKILFLIIIAIIILKLSSGQT
jgi:inner membrane protein